MLELALLPPIGVREAVAPTASAGVVGLAGGTIAETVDDLVVVAAAVAGTVAARAERHGPGP